MMVRNKLKDNKDFRINKLFNKKIIIRLIAYKLRLAIIKWVHQFNIKCVLKKKSNKDKIGMK